MRRTRAQSGRARPARSRYVIALKQIGASDIDGSTGLMAFCLRAMRAPGDDKARPRGRQGVGHDIHGFSVDPNGRLDRNRGIDVRDRSQADVRSARCGLTSGGMTTVGSTASLGF